MRSDALLALLDALLVVVAYCSIFVVRFDLSVPPHFWASFRTFLPLAVLVHLLSNWRFGLYGQMWRHASLQEACRVITASATAMVVLIAVALIGPDVPLSVNVFGAFLATMLLGGIRFQYRLFALRRSEVHAPGLRVLIIGAGETAASVIREMSRNTAANLVPVALLDDDPRKHDRLIGRVPVLGGIDRLEEAVQHFDIDQALLAIPSADQELVRRVSNSAASAGVTLKVLPPVQELLGGTVSVRDARDVRIEDLLGRKQVITDLDSVRRALVGRRVLVTGAGGSIGSEIARQVAACDPALLLMLDHDETHLHDAAAQLSITPKQLLADVRDRERIFELCAQWRPHVVFHAAAHKHVPLLEAHPCEAVLTNVIGTRNVAAAAARAGVDRFVFISTDKAVHPSSVMGASKWIGEQIVLSNAAAGGRFCAVRFGNVLGSRGSVIPTFVRQISAGGPVTVTDPRMTRYFMSTPEAVQLVLQASTFAQGGEVFMLEMGEPANILDLAHRMIRLSGRTVGGDIAVKIVGMRPGEKLTEELRAPDEEAFSTPHPSIVRLHPRVVTYAELRACIDDLTVLVEHRQDNRVAEVLLSVSNDPAVLEQILVRNNVRRGPDDIRVVRRAALSIVDPARSFSGGADVRDHAAGLAELEWSAPWVQPTT
ncbi:MAG: nucleoside-diphosphate sugar epimerase/dehydratase [Acidimicrobiales bacterium]